MRRSGLLATVLLAGCAQQAHHAAVPAAAGAVVPHASPTAASRSRALTTPHSPARRLSVTCYSATGHRTASGVWPRPGMAASNLFPLGTRLQVQHVGPVTVTDRVGHGTEVDLFGSSRAACVHFGRRQLLVTVLP